MPSPRCAIIDAIASDDVNSLPDPEHLVMSEAGGVRAFWITHPTMPGLVKHLATLLEEHMRDHDDLHVTYNSMQNGWREHPAQPGGLRRRPRAAWTELFVEYSAFIVLRARDSTPAGDQD
jgi:hypothetical protein